MNDHKTIECGSDQTQSRERVRYFPRQLLTADDLTQDQRYWREKLRHHNRIMHGWGVVCGLVVEPVNDPDDGHPVPWTVTVSPGYALGPYGDEIMVEEPVIVDLRRAWSAPEGIVGPIPESAQPGCCEENVSPPKDRLLYLAISYAEYKASPVQVPELRYGCNESLCEHSRILDGYELRLLSELPKHYSSEKQTLSWQDCKEPCRACPDAPWILLANITALDNGAITVTFTDRFVAVGAARNRYPCIDQNSMMQLTLQRGIYTIRQKSTNRFVDAHENKAKDFVLVTRPAQNNDSQRWIINPVGVVCTIRQKSTNRFVDAHENQAKDFALVTRTAQNNDTQKWVLTDLGSDTYTIQQLSNSRFVDAHENKAKDFALVTRPAQNDYTQKWVLTDLGNNTYTIQQDSSIRFVDAHENKAKDFVLVTRPAQNNDSQRWIINPVGVVCTIRQKSTNRFVDAHENRAKDFALVTRTAQNNDTQKWVLTDLGSDTYAIQQLSNSRFVDEHENQAKDFALVTRPAQNNDSQRWLVKIVPD